MALVLVLAAGGFGLSRSNRVDDPPAEVRPAAAARDAAVRVRGLGGGRLNYGAGVELAPGLVVTNRHVVLGAPAIRVDGGDDMPIEARVVAASVPSDLALLVVPAGSRLPTPLADTDPEPGTLVTIVGFELDGSRTAMAATLHDYVDGRSRKQASPVQRIRLDRPIPINEGVSGSPVVDATGRTAGVVYAVERATGFLLAVPASALERLRADAFAAVLPVVLRDLWRGSLRAWTPG